MPARSIIVLILGVMIALGAAVSLHHRMSGPAAVEGTKVLIASSDIAAGSFVRSGSNLAFADWPRDNITDTMLTSDKVKPAEFDGAVARRAISKGEPIQRSMLVKSNEGGFMSSVLEPGKRAISIAVDSTSGNAGFIFPGDHVDLLLTHAVNNPQNHAIERASETFIEDVRVLAIDQMLDNPENKAVLAKTVTLEVTPKQAEEINVAKDLGKISLSLRSLSSRAQAAAVPVTLPGEPPAPMPANLDDVLRDLPGQPANPDMDDAHITRDTEVSKIIVPQNAAGSSVRVIRGNTQEIIQFNGEIPVHAQ